MAPNSDLSFNPRVCLSVLSVWMVYCGKTADCIWLPCGVVSGVGKWMGILDGVEIVEERAVLRVNVEHPIVTNEEFCCVVVQNYVNRSSCHLR